MSLAEIKGKFVDPFPNRIRRRNLYLHLEEFIQTFLVAGIRCEIWLDGSFLTQKPEPGDLDVTVILDADVGESLTEAQQQLVDSVALAPLDNDIDGFVREMFAREPKLSGRFT